MSQPAADRNLLFGILALQIDFISRDALITAMNAWVLDKAKPLGHILREHGQLSGERLQLLDALVEEHLRAHGNDAQQSLAALSSVSSVKQNLQAIDDPELHLSLGVAGAQAARRDPVSTVDDVQQAGPRFRVLRPHAKGGLGAISVALDQELHREVALKEIQEKHADDPHSRGRFLLEAEITGGLEHPGIVPVYSLGSYGDGRPFYAMRFIKGDNLMEAIKRFHEAEKPGRDPGARSLAFRQLLGRFVDVCQAVAYAHSRGVLHRDLKPGNIMLGTYGETLVVDWGLAKAVGRALTEREGDERTLKPSSGSEPGLTQAGSALGTPEYMSPEQAAGRLDELGPASDVYSLGATLYTLLAGRAAFRRQDNLGETLRQVQRGEFPTPRAMKKDVPAALEALCLKAMALRQENRYVTALALAADVEHWLADEPVGAYPERWRVRAWRWLRRHPATAAAGLVTLLAAGVVAVVVAVLSEQGRQAVEGQRQLAVEAAEAERAANEKAQMRLRQVEKGNEILTAIFADLDMRQIKQGPDPLEAVLARRLVQAADQLEGEAMGDPLVVAGLQERLGLSLYSLGHFEGAIVLFKKARATRTAGLGPDHPDTLTSMNNLATGYRAAGRLDLALPLLKESLELTKAKLGADHPHTLTSMNSLATGYYAAGKLDLALPLYDETYGLRKARLGPDHPDTLMSMHCLADSYRAAGKLDLALPLLEETLKLRRVKLGPDHPDTLQSMNSLAVGYSAGKVGLALPLYEETFKLRKAKLGADHPDTLTSMNNLAAGYYSAGKVDLALPLYEETLKLMKAKLGSDHPDTLSTMHNLARVYQAASKLDLALPLYEETLELRKAKLGANHPDTLNSMNSLAYCYQAASQLDRALLLYEETLELRKAQLGADHPDTLLSMNNLALGYHTVGKPDLALPLFQEAARGIEKRRFQHEHAGLIVNNLIACYEQFRQYDQAEAWRRKWLTVVKERSGADSLPYAGALAALGLNLLAQQKWTDAEAVLRECLAVREKKEPDAWTTFNTKSLLGAALAGQQQYAEAEPLLLSGYEGMKARVQMIPGASRSRLAEAVDRLIRLYDAWGKPEQAGEWLCARESLPPPPKAKPTAPRPEPPKK